MSWKVDLSPFSFSMKPVRVVLLATLSHVGLLLSPLPGQAAQEERKFHLIYQVTAPAVEVGAAVSIEPGLLTNGERLVFAFDYCRRHYPEINGDTRRRNEEQVAIAQVVPEDQADLMRYCKMEEFRLKGEQFTVLDNAGVGLALKDASFTPGTLHSSGLLSVPERFTARIIGIDGAPTDKLPPAQQAQQPYVFLMSRNRALLEQVVPVAEPGDDQKQALLVRLERYKQRRRVEDPKGKMERCGLYIHDGQTAKPYDSTDFSWWRGLPVESPLTAEVSFIDLDFDNHTDMVATLLELRSHTMVRVYLATGSEYCALRMNDLNLHPLFRPITVLKTRNCTYAYANRYELATNSMQRVVPLRNASDQCRHHDVWRWYERH